MMFRFYNELVGYKPIQPLHPSFQRDEVVWLEFINSLVLDLDEAVLNSSHYIAVIVFDLLGV